MINIDLNKLVVIDIETLSNLFTMCARDVATGNEKKFVIYDSAEYEGQAYELYKFLRQCRNSGYTFITYNGIAFDMQILHYYFVECTSIEHDKLYDYENSVIINNIYRKAQSLIERQDGKRNEDIVYENNLFIPTIDLMVQNHYNVPGKYTSLKWLEFTMNFPNIEEMPIEHDDNIKIGQIEDILAYNSNDVAATNEFYKRRKYETELRLSLSKEYNKNLVNASEPKMAREIFGKMLCEEMKISNKELREMKTIRKYIKFEDIIFPYTSFVTEELKELLVLFKSTIADCTPQCEKTFKYSKIFGGLKIDFGLGGIHACIAPGVYKHSEDEVIEDLDVVSFYPNLAIENNLKPQQLGSAFTRIYKDIFEQRKLIPKSNPKNYIYKILLNSTFGLSSEINSYFYDKKFTYAITVNGQLSLLMLAEALVKSVPNIKLLQMNTDGLTYICKKEYLNIVEKISKWWQDKTKLSLEKAEYKNMIIQDVNNYIAVYEDGHTKKKGIFETELMLHKNSSNLIIPKALDKFFIEGVKVEDTIKNSDNIFDFCGAVKGKSNFDLNLYKNVNSIEIVEKQQKVTRFIVSNSKEAGMLVKDFHDGRKISVMANTRILPANIINETRAKLYDINYNYYIKECNKIIENIIPPVTQTTLF